MKQTSNAIKFLMAQYRAIFKSAYFKGLATAAVITAGLAVGAAQAAYVDGTTKADGEITADDFFNSKAGTSGLGNYTETITKNQKVNLGSTDWTKATGWYDPATGIAYTGTWIINGANLSIDGVKDHTIGIRDLTVTNGGNLTISNTGTANTSILGFTGGTDADGSYGTFVIEKNSSVNITSAGIELQKVSLTDNSSLTIGGIKKQDYSNATKDLSDAAKVMARWESYSHVWGNDATTVSDSKVNLNHESYLATSKSLTISGNSTVNLNGQRTNLRDEKYATSVTTKPSGDGYATAFLYGNSSSKGITFVASKNNDDTIKATPTLNVADGAVGAIYSHTIKFQNADLNVGSGSTLILDGNFTAKTSDAANSHKATTISFRDVDTNNQGTIIIGNATSGGTSTVAGDTNLTGDLINYSNIKVTNNVTSSKPAANATTGHLTISENQLVRTKDDEGNYVASGIFAGTNGIILQSLDNEYSEAILTLVGTDADGLDLNKDVSFVSQTDISNYSGTGTAEADFYAGKILVRNNATIDGEHLVLREALSLADISKLTVDGDTLELGANDYSGASLTGLGIVGAKAHDDVILNASGSTFTVDGPLELSRDFYTKDPDGNYTSTQNGVGTIHGDNLVLDTNGKLNITGGAWQNENQGISIVKGSLNVSASTTANENFTSGTGSDGVGRDWTYYKNANPASLDWNGDFTMSGGDVTVSGASGANATLDLTDADITWDDGTITLTGATDAADGGATHTSDTDFYARAGQGILRINGTQLSDYWDLELDNGTRETTSEIKIGSGGVLFVEGNVSGDIDFERIDSGAGNVFFSGAGWLVSTGEMSFATGLNETAGVALTIENDGVIAAQGISISDRNTDLDATERDELANDVVQVSGGTISVASRFSSDNYEVQFNGASLTLNSHAFERFGLTTATENGAVAVEKLSFSGTDSELEVEAGDWTVGANSVLGDIELTDSAHITVGDSRYFAIKGYGASLTADNLSITKDAAGGTDLSVLDGGEVTLNTIQGESTNISVTGTLTINGRNLVATDLENEKEPESLIGIGSTAEDINAQAGIDLTGATINVNGGDLIFGNTAASALVKFNVADGNTTDVVQVNEAIGNITLDNGAMLKLAFDDAANTALNSGNGLTAEQARDLKAELVDGLNRGSYINVGQLKLDMDYDPKTMTAKWADIKDFVKIESEVGNDDFNKVLVTGITSSDEISGNFGAVEADVVGVNTIRVDGNLGLHRARAGYFASVVDSTGARKAIGLQLNSYSTAVIYGEGIVGPLAGSSTADDSMVIFNEGELLPGTTTVEGNISGIGEIIARNAVNVKGDVNVGGAFITSDFSANNVTVDGHHDTFVMGNLNVAETLTVGGSNNRSADFFVADGTVVTKNLTLRNGSFLNVGWEAADVDDQDSEDFNEAANYTGRLQAQVVDLGRGGLMVDPSLDQQTAVVSFDNFTDYNKAQGSKVLGTINGSVYVGRNSALGLGSENFAEIDSAIAQYQNNGSLNGDVNSILYVDGNATLGAGYGITMTRDTSKNFNAYMAKNNWSLDKYSTVANSIYFGEGTAMKITAEAINALGTKDGGNAIISIASDNGTLIADGGEILIDGDVRAATYTLFADNKDGVTVVNVDHSTAEEGEGIQVSTENGFLVGELNSTTGGTITLGVNTDGRAIMAGASDPVYANLVAYAQGYNGTKTTAADGTTDTTDYLYHGYTTVDNGDGTTTQVKDTNYSNEFLQNVISTGNGRDAETAARLGMLGGVAQSAMAAGASTYDAIAGRMGVGSSMGNVTIANNTQGASLWLTPIYKNSESDGFEADNLDYGVDIDLYGVALGADFTMQNGVRVGAMFNVGSGDADGNGAGSAVSNDFDYYGFGVYAGYTYGAFSVLADVTYTVADNDVEGSTSLGQVSTSLDSTNLSVGVTGQYNLNLGGVDVTPHAGLRFSSIDIDDYDVADIASYDADSLNIFSIPVGVTFAKEFQGEAWTWKPSLDITVQGNFGDDSADGTVHWAGIDNLKADISSEVIDNFTYGATLGVAAQTGNFSMGLGINYTGSSNVDDYGVSANARFVF